MRYRSAMAAVIIAAVAALFLSSRPKSAPASPALCFVGFTNAVGAQEPVFRSRLYQAALQSWHVTGSNVAIFTITNPQSHTLLIMAYGQLMTRGTPGHTNTFFLQITNFPHFFLGPKQGAVLLAGFPEHPAPWKMRLFYHRDTREHSISDVLKGVARSLGGSRQTRESPVESGWIDSVPEGQVAEKAEAGERGKGASQL